jgi:hypothetical protein
MIVRINQSALVVQENRQRTGNPKQRSDIQLSKNNYPINIGHLNKMCAAFRMRTLMRLKRRAMSSAAIGP